MEFINPRLTIQNVLGSSVAKLGTEPVPAFLVRMEHEPNPGERIDITVLLSGAALPTVSVDELQQRVIRKTLAVLQAMLGEPPAVSPTWSPPR